MIKIRDEKGEVFNKIKNPACIVDTEFDILLKIGEKEDMENYFKKLLNASFSKISNKNYAYIDLPKDQKEIDKIFNITGYIKKYIKGQ